MSRLEQAAGIGIGDHHRRDVRPEPRLQRLEIDPAVARWRGCSRPDSRRRRRWRDWCRARFRERGRPRAHRPAPPARRGCTSRPHSSPCAPAFGLIATPCMPVSVTQPFAELRDHLQRALHGVDRLERMDVGEAGQPRDLLVEPRIVLHRARAEREEAEVDRVILPAEAGVVAHRLAARRGRADRSGGCARARRDGSRRRALASKSTPVRAVLVHLEEQAALPASTRVAGAGLRLLAPRRFQGGSGRQPDGFMLMPAPPQARLASASTSSSLLVSVTATTRPFCSASAPG